MSLRKAREHVFRVTWERWNAMKLWNRDLFSGKTTRNCPVLAKHIWWHDGVKKGLAEGGLLLGAGEHRCSGEPWRRVGGCGLTVTPKGLFPSRMVSLRRTTTLLSEQRLRNNDEAGENHLPGASNPSANFFSWAQRPTPRAPQDKQWSTLSRKNEWRRELDILARALRHKRGGFMDEELTLWGFQGNLFLNQPWIQILHPKLLTHLENIPSSNSHCLVLQKNKEICGGSNEKI